jgi:hypothetical protein
LRDGDKADALAIKCLDDFGEVGERASQAINLVDNNRIDPSRSNISYRV